MMKKILTIMLAAMLAVSIAGCGSKNSASQSNNITNSNTDKSKTETNDNTSKAMPNLRMGFGRDNHDFTLSLYNNDTAAEIARYVGEADWNLPIYHFDDFDNYQVMQYYDIPSRYKITSAPETVTSEKAGEVYYSSPNRILLFYQDAQVKGEFTKIGNLRNTNGLKEAVEKNPVVPGWGNKIISISLVK